MARLPETPASTEEATALAELGYKPAEIALLTPEERAALVEPDNALDVLAHVPADALEQAAANAQVTEDTDSSDLDPIRGKSDKADTGLPDRVDDTRMPTQRPKVDAVTDKVVDKAADKIVAAVVDDKVPDEAKKPGPFDDDDDDEGIAPLLPMPAARDFDAEAAALSAKREALTKSFDEGDITNEDYRKQERALTRDERSLDAAQTEYDLTIKLNTQAAGNLWLAQQRTFHKTNPGYRPPAPGTVPSARFLAMNELVKTIATDPKNAQRSGEWVLLSAKKMVEAEFGPPAGAKADDKTTPAKPAEAAKPPPARAKPDLKSVPVTLAHVPPASLGDEDVGGESKFDSIDKMDGLDQEFAIAQLSERELNAYLKHSERAA